VRWGIVSAVMMAGSDSSSLSSSVDGDEGDVDSSRVSCSGMLGIRLAFLVICGSACGEGIAKGGNESIVFCGYRLLYCTMYKTCL
jgi:hypothetical protein